MADIGDIGKAGSVQNLTPVNQPGAAETNKTGTQQPDLHSSFSSLRKKGFGKIDDSSGARVIENLGIAANEQQAINRIDSQESVVADIFGKAGDPSNFAGGGQETIADKEFQNLSNIVIRNNNVLKDSFILDRFPEIGEFLAQFQEDSANETSPQLTESD